MFSKSFQAYPDAVLVTRLRDGKVIEVNDGFEVVAGYARDEVIGSTTLAEGMWEDPEDRVRMIERLKQDGSVRGYEFLGRRATGESRLCRMSAEIFDGFDEPHLVTVIEDITELRRLQSEAVEAADAERQRVAWSLHDGVAQELAGASYLLRSLSKSLPAEVVESRTKLTALQTTLTHAIETVRAVAKGLSPIEIRHGGLEIACRRLALEIATIYEMEVVVNYSPLVRDCSRATKTALYYIVHEAVFNAAKHSGCRRIEVSLDVEDDYIFASIQDDGAGLESDEAQTGGLGMQLMTQRAEALGGSIVISSSPGNGTLLRCSLPHVKRQQQSSDSTEHASAIECQLP